jgi:protein ImuB
MAKSQEQSLPLFPDDPPGSIPAPGLLTPSHLQASANEHLWLALRLPRLALDVFAPDQDAVIVVEGEGSQRSLVACNTWAENQGLRVGMGLNAAFALAPGVRVLERDPECERASLERLAAWAGQFTSWVSLEAPDTLLLELKGSLRLFGGLSVLQTRIVGSLEQMGYQVRQGVAPTPMAALWLSRAARTQPPLEDAACLAGRLGGLPVDCLGWESRQTGQLYRLGVRSIADCLRLPRDGFARRFGPGRLGELDKALGRMPDPRPGFVAPRRFRGDIELPAETDSSARLLPALERLVEELVGMLRSREAGVDSLRLDLLHSDGAPTRITLQRLSLTRDRQHMLSLLAGRLERHVLPSPVLGLTLASGMVRPLCGPCNSLLDDALVGDEAALPMLVERLCVRLGDDAVHGLCLVPEHRPEAAWRRSGRGSPGRGLEQRVARPLWILDAPLRLGQHKGQPVYGGPLLLVSGPERIETGWWDGEDVARDYFRARTVHGECVWIYQDRREQRDWYLHGIFG